MGGLDNRFKGKYEDNNKVSMDLSSNTDLAQKVIKQKCKQFNIWNATNITDLNKADLVEFAEFNKENKNDQEKKINIDDEGRVYLDGLNKFILDQSMISKERIKKILNNLWFGMVNVVLNHLVLQQINILPYK